MFAQRIISILDQSNATCNTGIGTHRVITPLRHGAGVEAFASMGSGTSHAAWARMTVGEAQTTCGPEPWEEIPRKETDYKLYPKIY